MGKLAPSLLTAPWRKELLMLAGDVETNPGPWTDYGKNLCMVLMHIPTSSYLLRSKCNYHKITSWYAWYIFITNLMTIITVNHNFTMPLLTCVTMTTCDKIWKDVGSNPGPYTQCSKDSCDIT